MSTKTIPTSGLGMHCTFPCCGVEISMAIQTSRDVTEPSWITNSADVLKYWLQDRVSRHDCLLVSKTNPMGLRPKEKT